MTQADKIRALAKSGLPKATVMEMTGCSRQAYDAAVRATPRLGRPRKTDRARCPHCLRLMPR